MYPITMLKTASCLHCAWRICQEIKETIQSPSAHLSFDGILLMPSEARVEPCQTGFVRFNDVMRLKG